MGIGTLLIVILRDTAVLGNVLHLFTLPGLITLRLVNIGATLSRMEIIFAAALMMLLFFKITLLLYISVRAISSLFELTTFKNLTLIVGVFLAFYAVTLFIDPVLHAQSAQKSVVIVWTLFEILIPILTLIIALFRKLPKNNEKEKAIIKKTDYKIQLNYQWLKYKKKESKSSKTKQKTAKQGG